jgi:ectoine hydroxylase-related dioxygenase (phytanoyl-CoA dioxygenase family)
LGCDPEKVFFDVPRLRSAYPTDYLAAGIAYAFHPHRDTWYSAPMCQLNWWLPIYPIVPENGLAFYPRYFSEPVKNNSEIYNYYEWNARSRATAAQHIKKDTREQPKPQEPLEPEPRLRVICPPGGVILFSGAQMHETVPNTAGITRYSIDFRTVQYDDVVNRRGAVNVDSRCTGTTMRDYLRTSDLSRLPEEVVSLYDDGTEVTASVLVFPPTRAAAAAGVQGR